MPQVQRLSWTSALVHPAIECESRRFVTGEVPFGNDKYCNEAIALQPPARVCLTVAKPSDGMMCNVKSWLSRLRSCGNQLRAVVGINTEADDRGDSDRLIATHGRLEFPTAKGGKHFGRHAGGARFEH